ncbi:hypothetical protein C0993_007872, partial [Termitomyces sp. T159_Od127]
GLIAFGLVRAHTSILAGFVVCDPTLSLAYELRRWQFLFLVMRNYHRNKHSSYFHQKIEAIPTLVMALAILLFLPSFPFTARFLTPRERAIAQARLNRDHKPQSHGGMTGWQGFKAVVADPNAWLFAMIYASCEYTLIFSNKKRAEVIVNVGVATISYFLPTVSVGYVRAIANFNAL